mgnify:CR=1 FL=1
MATNSKNYIDNKEFLAEIIEWRDKFSEDNNIQISESIAKKLLLICRQHSLEF